MNKANFFWSGSPLKRQHFAVYKSFIKHGWDVTVWTYDSALKDVDKIKFRDANEILNHSRLGTFTYENCNVHEVPFSDLFRLYVMHHTSGWWFDSDCFCLRDYSDFELLTYNRYYLGAWEFEGSINNAVLYFSNKELLWHLISSMESQLDHNMIWGKIGPRGLTKTLSDLNLTYQALPSWAFYPISWDKASYGIDDAYADYMKDLCKKSLTYHYYNSICHGIEEPKGYIQYLTEQYS